MSDLCLPLWWRSYLGRLQPELQSKVNEPSLQQTKHTFNFKSLFLRKHCWFLSFQYLHIFKCLFSLQQEKEVPLNTATAPVCCFQEPRNKCAQETGRTEAFQHLILIMKLHPKKPGGGKAALNKMSFKCCCCYLHFHLALCTHQRTKSFLLYLQANTFPISFLLHLWYF